MICFSINRHSSQRIREGTFEVFAVSSSPGPGEHDSTAGILYARPTYYKTNNIASWGGGLSRPRKKAIGMGMACISHHDV